MMNILIYFLLIVCEFCLIVCIGNIIVYCFIGDGVVEVLKVWGVICIKVVLVVKMFGVEKLLDLNWFCVLGRVEVFGWLICLVLYFLLYEWVKGWVMFSDFLVLFLYIKNENWFLFEWMKMCWVSMLFVVFENGWFLMIIGGRCFGFFCVYYRCDKKNFFIIINKRIDFLFFCRDENEIIRKYYGEIFVKMVGIYGLFFLLVERKWVLCVFWERWRWGIVYFGEVIVFGVILILLIIFNW